jgi:hypothetical protein
MAAWIAVRVAAYHRISTAKHDGESMMQRRLASFAARLGTVRDC